MSKKIPMRNITINIPDIFDDNIQKLIKLQIVANRSEALRFALREFIQNEFDNLKLLGYFDKEKGDCN